MPFEANTFTQTYKGLQRRKKTNFNKKEAVPMAEVSFVSWTTSHFGLCSFLESIERDSIKALMIYTDNHANSDLAQLVVDPSCCEWRICPLVRE